MNARTETRGVTLTVAPLGRGDIRQAYALVREAMPAVSVDDWQRFAGALLDRRRRHAGILCTWSDNRYVRGLAAYAVRAEVDMARVLRVELLIVSTMFAPSMVLNVIKNALEDCARHHGCAGVKVEIPADREWLIGAFALGGYHPAGACLVKPIA